MMIGPTEASRYLGISVSLLRWRANAGHVPVARRKPLRFKVSDLITYSKTAPPARVYTRRHPLPLKPTALSILDDRLAQLLEATKGN